MFNMPNGKSEKKPKQHHITGECAENSICVNTFLTFDIPSQTILFGSHMIHA